MYSNIEIIFVDDGSTDNSSAYAHKCLDDTKGDLVITLKANKGVGHALNTGFAWAKGEYLCFFAADDILISPEKTYYQQMLMESTGADLSYYLDWYQGTDKDTMEQVSGKWCPSYIPIGYFLKNFLHHSKHLFHWYLMHHDPINSGSFMIRKGSYLKFGNWNETVLTTDYDLLLRYCKLGAKFLPLKGAPMFYRIHPKQSSYRTKEMQEGIEETRRVNQ
jgi:glycosyltransferase involved in cell wall biosynthesis